MEHKYPITPEEAARNDNNFVYHAPIGDQVSRYAHIRSEAKRFADVLLHNCPRSRELSIALTELETAVMFANSAIARNEKEPAPND